MSSHFTISKVLMTADSIGGVWTYALELVRALQPHGVKVLLATMGRPVDAEQRTEAGSLSNLEMVESTFRLEWMAEPWEDIASAGEWLLNLEADFSPDIVHLNGYAHGSLPWAAPKLIVAHSCVLSWWQGVHGEHAPEIWTLYRDAVRAGLSAADLVIAPTSAMLACLREHYCQLPRSCVIPNGRALDLFTVAEKEKFTLSAGRIWDEAKNIGAVYDCSPRLPWPVFVAGETSFPESRQSSVPGSAICLGKLTSRELLNLMARAGIFVHPAKYEPFGLSILEAALSGCALVLGDLPSLRENWDGAALFVDPNDPGALRATLLRLIDDQAFREQIAREATIRGRQFDIQFTADRYLAAYESLIREREEVCAVA